MAAHPDVAELAGSGLTGYEQVAEIHRSARAVVWRAWQPRFRRWVAIKLLLDVSPEQLERVSRAAGALTSHPNVAHVHDLGVTAQGTPFAVMDLLGEDSLADIVGRQGPMDWYDASRIAIKLAGVVESARRIDAGRLPVEPEHVLLSRFGEPTLTVFHAHAPADGEGALGETLLFLLGGRSAIDLGPLAAVGDVAVLTAVDLANRLKRLQADAARSVTEMPVDVAEGVTVPVASPDAVTAAPSTRRSRHGRIAALLATLLAALVAAAFQLAPDRRADEVASTAGEPTTTALPTTTTLPPATGGNPVEPALFSDAFTPAGGWTPTEGNGVSRRFEDGQYRVTLTRDVTASEPMRWTAATPETRISVSLEGVLLSGAPVQIGVACGTDSLGGVVAMVGSDGSWRLFPAFGGLLLASGTSAQAELVVGKPFVIRLDCAEDRAPGRLTLWLNDTRLGEAFSTLTSGMSHVAYYVDPATDAGADVVLRGMAVTRLA